MKKSIYSFLIVLFILSCDNENVGPNSDSGLNNGSNDGQGGSLATFALKGDYLYVVDESTLNVFSIKEAGNPVKVNSVHVGFQIETLFSYKDYLYIGSRNGMFIYSISSPEFPGELASVSHFTACDPVIANDTNAFVTLHTNFNCGNNINVLEIYDIKNITQPKLISSRNLASPKGLGLYNNYLIVCDDEIKVFDISDPENTVLVNSIDEAAFDVIIQGDVLIAIGDQGVYQYKIEHDFDKLKFDHLSTIQI